MRNCDGDIKTLRPTVFVGVPTVLEKIKKEVERKVAASGAFTRGLFKWAFNRKVAARAQGQSTPILDKIIFNKFKQLVGGRCRLMVSGGAYLSPAVQTFMETCFSTKVAQGYGLTETCGPACFQEPTDTRIGSIGAPFPSVEVKLVDVPEMGYTHLDKPQPRGELWIRGNSVASGYYKNEEESKKAITPDGWFKTGDVGELTPDGTFIIIDRVKNLVKPPHGEYIACVPRKHTQQHSLVYSFWFLFCRVERLESIYRDLSCVEQILVYADNHHNEVVAIVVPQHAAVVKFAEANKIAGDDFGHLVREPAVKKWILKALQDTGRQKGLKSIETVRSVFVTSDEWTPENDLLTAANKVKRQLIVKKYKQEIDAMYEELSRADE
jgi:long-chain acyl-CoA synthetase